MGGDGEEGRPLADKFVKSTKEGGVGGAQEEGVMLGGGGQGRQHFRSFDQKQHQLSVIIKQTKGKGTVVNRYLFTVLTLQPCSTLIC